MSTPTRSVLSALIGPAFTAFTVCSATFLGPLAPTSLVAFGLTVVWGIVEIAQLTYTRIDAIDLDDPSLRDRDAETDARVQNLVTFAGPNPWRDERAA